MLRRALLNERARADALAAELKRLSPAAGIPPPRGIRDDQHAATVREAVPDLVIAPPEAPRRSS